MISKPLKVDQDNCLGYWIQVLVTSRRVRTRPNDCGDELAVWVCERVSCDNECSHGMLCGNAEPRVSTHSDEGQTFRWCLVNPEPWGNRAS